ncbi:MAG: hypothetical protein ABII23_07440 [bacterium]
MNMITSGWSKAGYSIYWYIQYKLYLVFYVMGISLYACVLVAGNIQKSNAASVEHNWIYSMCDAVTVDDDLEVRDAQGRIVQQSSAQTSLRDLFVTHLAELLYQADIHSIALSQASLKKTLSLAERMIALPFNAVQTFVFTAIVPSIKKFYRTAGYSRRLISPEIPILIFPGFVLFILSRRLSSVILRV